MRPDDRRLLSDEEVDSLSVPLDTDLESLDAELEAAGALSRRGLHGRVQPTRAYEIALRRRLLAAFPAPVAADATRR